MKLREETLEKLIELRGRVTGEARRTKAKPWEECIWLQGGVHAFPPMEER
jgi:hypothetical protein